MKGPLVLTYHSVSEGPAPLCVSPALFARHVEVIAASGATVHTVTELADGLRAGELPSSALAITFDDGFADTADVAAPILRAHGFRATVFCVSGFLGLANDWPTQPASAPRRPLATPSALANLVDAEWEIGAHGVDHAPLDGPGGGAALGQIERSRTELEAALGAHVTSFAFPYGGVPQDAAAALRAAGFTAGCTTKIARVDPAGDPLLLPRVDAHYVRSPRLLDLVLGPGGGGYLACRRLGAAVRSLT